MDRRGGLLLVRRLPRHYYLIEPGGKSTQDFRVTEVRPVVPPLEDLVAIPQDGDWNVGRIGQDLMRGWLFSLVKPDLVP